MKVKVNDNLCVGCGLCVVEFPEAFRFNDYGVAEVIGEVEEKDKDELLGLCPVNAIEKG
jgi:ferredoxin